MIRATTFAGSAVAVFGLGATGIATARSLLAGGAEAAAWDDNAASRSQAAAQGVPIVDLAAADLSRFSALALAPGVPLTHPAPHWSVARARAAGVPVIGDIEIFCRERAAQAPGAPFVAITGTNGKSTTTALIAHLLRCAGLDAELGGNIGTPVLALEPPAAQRIHVVEMSSFQIDLTPSLAPSVGVLLNLSPDHLDRHGSMEHYAAVKARLVLAAGHAVIGIGDDWCRAVRSEVRKAGRSFDEVAVDAPVAHGFEAEGSRIVSVAPQLHPQATIRRPVADLAGIGSLRGRHNAQNAAAAAAVAARFGVGAKVIAAALKTFAGLPHRMEEVGRLRRVLFINDSKATNADSTEKALAAFPRDIYWILGGKPKEGGITALAAYFPRVAKAYLIGAASDAFAATLAGRVAAERCETLERALAAAARDAAASPATEPVVLLSPACASYDQFRNFEQRGDLFRSLVRALPGVTPHAC